MAANPSKDKGTRAEILVRDTLVKHTGLNWQRTPLSGALDPKHGMKSDLYIPNANSVYAVEVKHYADSSITHLLIHGVNPTLVVWWEQCVRQADQVSKKPLLIFKHDRSKLFVAFAELPSDSYNYLYVSRGEHGFFVALLEDWLCNEDIKFVA